MSFSFPWGRKIQEGWVLLVVVEGLEHRKSWIELGGSGSKIVVNSNCSSALQILKPPFWERIRLKVEDYLSFGLSFSF